MGVHDEHAHDWLYLGGLLGIGVALIAGIAMRIAAASGALLLVPAMALVLLAALRAGDVAGLGDRWRTLPVVRDHTLPRQEAARGRHPRVGGRLLSCRRGEERGAAAARRPGVSTRPCSP